MKTVKQLLQMKGFDVWSITSSESVYDALRLMADRGIGALLVVDAERLVGVVSERDYARKVALQGRSSQTTSVAEIMSSNVIYVDTTYTVEECMSLMTERRVRHLPVVEGGRLVGIVSIGDVVKALLSEKDFLIQQLEHYITGAG